MSPPAASQDSARPGAGEAQEGKAKKPLSMSTWVLISFGAGIVAGLVFGEMLAWMAVIGDAFIKLLQMTIIPYIMVSLISSLGNLSYEQARSLGVKVGKLMLVIWAVGLVAIYLIKFSFPQWQAGDFFSLSTLEDPNPVNLMDLYIPANPFFSLSHSYIPAIVVFCVATGVALIAVEDKEPLIKPLQLLATAFNTVTQYIVKLMPLGIFAMTAATAGTMSFEEFQKLQVYFAAHIVMTGLLAYWALPALLAVMTPFSYRDLAGIARDALITAFAAGNIFIVLPLLIEHTKALFHKYDIGSEHTDDYANVIIPVVFSFPNLGKLLTIVFILFAAWFSGAEMTFLEYLPMAVNGLVSLFGSVYLTVPMLLDTLQLPTDLFQLYMVSSLFTSRFTSLLAAMNLFALAVGGTAMLTGHARLAKSRLLLYLGLTPLVVGLTLFITGFLLKQVVNTEYQMDQVVAQMRSAEQLPEAVQEPDWEGGIPLDGPRSLDAIKESGVLRIGYNPMQVPFSYYNANNELVGLDVEMMRKLATDLEVEAQFIPYNRNTVLPYLDGGGYDLLISGLQMTTKRIQRAGFTDPVLDLHYSLVVKDHRADDFASDELIAQAGPLLIAAVGDYAIIPLIENRFPNVTVESIDSDRQFFNATDKAWDGLLISLEAGKTWTMLYPSYTTLYKRDEIKSFPMAYVTAKSNLEWRLFLNNWLAIQRSSGYIDKLYGYWILGENAQPPKARWSLLKDVLGWVDAPPPMPN